MFDGKWHVLRDVKRAEEVRGCVTAQPSRQTRLGSGVQRERFGHHAWPRWLASKSVTANHEGKRADEMRKTPMYNEWNEGQAESRRTAYLESLTRDQRWSPMPTVRGRPERKGLRRMNSDTVVEDPNQQKMEKGVKYQGQIALISARGFDGGKRKERGGGGRREVKMRREGSR